MNKILQFAFVLIGSLLLGQTGEVFGVVTNQDGKKLSDVKVEVVNGKQKTETYNGNYSLKLKEGDYRLKFYIDDATQEFVDVKVVENERTRQDIVLMDIVSLEGVELFGSINKQPEKLDLITRLPLKPSENIQTITTISNKVIEKQGILTIKDAVRNAPGVYTYAEYGGRGQSIGARGFRGIPILKNGVRIHSDFRGLGFLTDMQGVESVQVIKGASTISQGFGLDLGAAGGVVNLVTKTPDFDNFGNVSLRYGSWNQIRPTFDVNAVISKENNLAFRVNGAYEHSDGYRDNNSNNRYYINPSLRWMPVDNLDIKLEMDYMDDKKTADPGTINLSKDNTENIMYDMPKNKFLGFENDKYINKVLTYSGTLKYDVDNNFYIKAGYYGAKLNSDGESTLLNQTANADGIIETPNLVKRDVNKPAWRKDDNQVGQIDFVLHNMQTGDFKHLAQVGADFRRTKLETKTFNTITYDEIDVFANNISNTRDELNFNETGGANENNKQYGFLAQYVVEYKDWARLFAGVRYSNYESNSVNGRLNRRSGKIEYTETSAKGNTWNPIFGLMVYPVKQIGLFTSYTNTSNPRSASKLDENKNELGNETSNQFEVGFKSEWFKNRLRFNATYFKVENKNMIMQDVGLDAQGSLEFKPWYIKGGDDLRQGIELEVIGRITNEWEVMAGYSWLDAEYQGSTRFVDGSKPNNTPDNVANFWTNYTFSEGALNGFNIGAGVYYLGSRPYNDYVFTAFHGIVPGLKPWENKAYTTVNAQLGYTKSN